MNFSQQLKKYRNRDGLSQEDLAEKIYVTRQTISKWENDKTYPDIHNLIALSILFDITLDDLIKGDVKKMKENVDSKLMFMYSKLMVGSSLLVAIFIGPSLVMFDWVGLIFPLSCLGIMMFAAFKIEKLKKEANIKTYAEILAYTEERNVNIERSKRDKKIDLRHKILMVIVSGLVTGVLAGISMWISIIYSNK